MTGPVNNGIATRKSIPEYGEWIAALVIALAGMALTIGGTVLTFLIDQDQIEENVESGEISVVLIERDLTEAEMLEFTPEVVSWTGIGLLVTGLGLVLFAIGYVVTRHRAHQRSPEGGAGSYRSSADLGAVVTGVLSFLPISPVFGGGVAGYLEHYGTDRSISVGVLSGFLLMLPLLVILTFVTIGIYSGLSAIQESGLGITTIVVMLFTILVVGAFGTGLGAVGGFVGGRLAES